MKIIKFEEIHVPIKKGMQIDNDLHSFTIKPNTFSVPYSLFLIP